MITNGISPYLQRPVRTLEEAMAEAEQQRLEQAVAGRSKIDDESAATPALSSADTAQGS